MCAYIQINATLENEKNSFPRYTVLLSLDIVIRHKTCEKLGSIDFMGMAKSHSFFHIEKGN